MTRTILGQRRLRAAAGGCRHGRDARRRALRPAASRRVASTGSSSPWPPRWCSGAAGRSSSVAWRSVVNRSLNMFTLIGLGVGVAYVYSLVATIAPGVLPAVVPRRRRRGAGLLRGGRDDHGPGPAGAGAGAARSRTAPAPRSARCWTWRRRRRGGSARTAAKRTCRSMRCAPATGCGCAPATRCRSTVVVARRAPAPSTSRWSPASRCRWRRPPATR